MRWPDPVANDVVPYAAAGLTHGPFLGRPASDSIRVWVRTAEPGPFTVVCDTRTPLTEKSRRSSGVTTPDRDSTGVVDLTRLEPDTRYYYCVVINGQMADVRIDFHDPWPSFRTLPDPSGLVNDKDNPAGLFNVCFSIGCCASQHPTNSRGQYGSTPAFDTLLREHGDEPMFHIFNGDTIYEELRDGTLEGVRANYRLYFSRGRSMSRLLRYLPGLFLYNDHELGGGMFGSGEVGLGSGSHLIRDIGLRAWEEYLGWANFEQPHHGSLRFGTALVERGDGILHDPNADFRTLRPEQVSTIHLDPYTRAQPPRRNVPAENAGVYGLTEVLDEHRLRVTPDFKTSERLEYSIGTHHFYDWTVGNCHFFALDTRGERTGYDPENVHDPSKSILGPVQRKWLEDGVRASDAAFLFIISPDPWVIHHTGYHGDPSPEGRKDKGGGFASYVHERERLLELFRGLGKPVLIFSGDVHNSMSVQISENVWEFLCGPMGSTAHPVGTAGGMPFGGPFDSQGRRVDVRWLAGFPDDIYYSRLRSTYYTVVQVNNVMTTTWPEGPGRRFVAYDAPQVVVRFHDGYTGRLAYAEAVSARDTPADRNTEVQAQKVP